MRVNSPFYVQSNVTLGLLKHFNVSSHLIFSRFWDFYRGIESQYHCEESLNFYSPLHHYSPQRQGVPDLPHQAFFSFDLACKESKTAELNRESTPRYLNFMAPNPLEPSRGGMVEGGGSRSYELGLRIELQFDCINIVKYGKFHVKFKYPLKSRNSPERDGFPGTRPRGIRFS